jgi:hypothetical protein
LTDFFADRFAAGFLAFLAFDALFPAPFRPAFFIFAIALAPFNRSIFEDMTGRSYSIRLFFQENCGSSRQAFGKSGLKGQA